MLSIHLQMYNTKDEKLQNMYIYKSENAEEMLIYKINKYNYILTWIA